MRWVEDNSDDTNQFVSVSLLLQRIPTHATRDRNATGAFPRPTLRMPCPGAPIAMHAVVAQLNEKSSYPFLVRKHHSPFWPGLCSLRTNTWHRINPILKTGHLLSSNQRLNIHVELIVHGKRVLDLWHAWHLWRRRLWRQVRRGTPF